MLRCYSIPSLNSAYNAPLLRLPPPLPRSGRPHYNLCAQPTSTCRPSERTQCCPLPRPSLISCPRRDYNDSAQRPTLPPSTPPRPSTPRTLSVLVFRPSPLCIALRRCLHTVISGSELRVTVRCRLWRVSGPSPHCCPLSTPIVRWRVGVAADGRRGDAVTSTSACLHEQSRRKIWSCVSAEGAGVGVGVVRLAQ